MNLIRAWLSDIPFDKISIKLRGITTGLKYVSRHFWLESETISRTINMQPGSKQKAAYLLAKLQVECGPYGSLITLE